MRLALARGRDVVVERDDEDVVHRVARNTRGHTMTRGAVEKRARGDESTARATRARLRRALCACAALGAACAAASAALGSTQMVLNARLSEAARRATPGRGLARGRVRAVSEARFAPPARGAARGRWRTRPRDDAGGDAATRGGGRGGGDGTEARRVHARGG